MQLQKPKAKSNNNYSVTAYNFVENKNSLHDWQSFLQFFQQFL